MRLFLLFFAGLLLTLPAWGQERLRNVRIRAIDSSQLEIRYDLLRLRPGDSVYFEVQTRTRGQLVPNSTFVRGDVGTRISAGQDKRIIWDALANGYLISEDIRVRVLLKTNTGSVSTQRAALPKQALPTAPVSETVSPQPIATAPTTETPSAPAVATVPTPVNTAAPTPTTATATIPADTVRRPRHRYDGPAWALLSVVAPGIGNIFVQTPKPKVGIRPALTLGCYGLIVYGLMERSQSMDAYATYLEQRNATAAMPYYLTANDLHHKYYLATRGALAVAAVDVLLTFFKGLHNGRMHRKAQPLQGVSLRPGMQASQFTAVVRYAF